MLRQNRPGRNRYRVSGGPAADVLDYGWPSGDTFEPDVIGQWLFDEASGAIVDEVNSVSLTANGSPSYDQAVGGGYELISPGITFDGTSAYFNKAGSEATLNLGTSDFTIEMWYEMGVIAGSKYVVSCLDASDGDKGYALILRTSAGSERVQLFLKSTDGVGATLTWSVSPETSGTPQHLRINATRTGDAELFLDDVSQGTQGVATFDGKTINAEDVTIGSYHTGGLKFAGTIYELRISKNNTNNSY